MASARDQALEVVRLKSEFMANLSHEIRTPMNAVIGFTDLILDSDLTAAQRDLLLSVRSSAAKLIGLLSDILDLSKIETGRTKLERVTMSLREAIQDAVGMFVAHAERKGLAMTADIAPDVPESALGDPTRLRQVLVNLVGNAVKFTEAGAVTVRVWSEAGGGDGACIHFAVVDTGVGIPTNKQRAIFQPFVQADGSMTRSGPGRSHVHHGRSARLARLASPCPLCGPKAGRTKAGEWGPSEGPHLAEPR